MSLHKWLLNPYILIFGQPCTHFILAYFYSFNFQLSTNKNAVVVVLLPLVQKWTSGHPSNGVIFDLLCQLILKSNTEYTGDRVQSSKDTPSTCTLWCHKSAELFTCSWFFNKILQNQLPTYRAAWNQLPNLRLCGDLVGNIILDVPLDRDSYNTITQYKLLILLCSNHLLRDSYVDLRGFVFLLHVIVLVLVSAARSWSVQNADCKRLENWLVLFDDFFCDTTQLVNLNCVTVNLPFSLFSSYIFPTHYLFHFDYRQYSILIFPFWLQMAYLLFTRDPPHLISTWFAWISHQISWNCFFFSNIFPYFRNRPWLGFPFITRHLYWTPKAKNLNCSQIAKSPTKYCALSFSTEKSAKRLRNWNQQYYCNLLCTTHLFLGFL